MMRWLRGFDGETNLAITAFVVLAVGLALMALPTVAGLGVLGLSLAGIVAQQRKALARYRELARTEDEWRGLLEAIGITPAQFCLFNARDELVAWNASYQAMHEEAFRTLPRPLRYEDLMRAWARASLPPEEVEEAVRVRLARHYAPSSEFDRLHPNGRWMRIYKRRLLNGGIASFAMDITELVEQRAALTASQARFQALAETVPVGIWQIDRTGHTVYANARLLALLDVSDAAALDSLDAAVLFPEAPGVDGPLRFQVGSTCETWLQTPAARRRLVSVVASPWVEDAAGHSSCVLTLTDVTAMRDAQARVEHMAHHDPLTDLGNRTVFNAAMNAVAAGNDSSAVLLVDLDHFKVANDRFGHATGDAVLRQVAERLRRAVRTGDTVCRLGGDEFAVVMRECSRAEAERVGQRIASDLLLPFQADGQFVQLSGSIGLTVASGPYRDPAILFREADLALYSIKRQGRAGVAFYEPSLAA